MCTHNHIGQQLIFYLIVALDGTATMPVVGLSLIRLILLGHMKSELTPYHVIYQMEGGLTTFPAISVGYIAIVS